MAGKETGQLELDVVGAGSDVESVAPGEPPVPGDAPLPTTPSPEVEPRPLWSVMPAAPREGPLRPEGFERSWEAGPGGAAPEFAN